jgi:hypothetical protein
MTGAPRVEGFSYSLHAPVQLRGSRLAGAMRRAPFDTARGRCTRMRDGRVSRNVTFGTAPTRRAYGSGSFSRANAGPATRGARPGRVRLLLLGESLLRQPQRGAFGRVVGGGGRVGAGGEGEHGGNERRGGRRCRGSRECALHGFLHGTEWMVGRRADCPRAACAAPHVGARKRRENSSTATRRPVQTGTTGLAPRSPTFPRKRPPGRTATRQRHTKSPSGTRCILAVAQRGRID